MRRRWAGLLVVPILVLAGCRSGEKRPADDRTSGPDRPADLSSRTKDPPANPDSPAHWLDRPKPDWMKGKTPAAPTWNGATENGALTASESNGLISGYVESPEGRKVRKVYVAVREVGDTEKGEVGVLSLEDGSFFIQGLKPGRNYVLTVSATEGDRKLFGVVYTKTPNPNVRIPLLEGELGGLPAARPSVSAETKPISGGPLPTDDPLKRPPTNSVPAPRSPFSDSGPLPAPDFGNRPQSRGDLPSHLPSPKPLERDTGLSPTGGYEVPGPNGTPPERADLMTDRGLPDWKPPTANIAPRTASPIPSATPNGRSESRRAEKFTLVDATGRDCNLPQSKLVLVQFFTTGSESCRRVVPVLNAVQERYAGRGVEVVGLACDDEPLKARVMAADQFARDLKVNYSLMTEPGKRPGEWMKKYGVAELPSAVLLDASGAVLWQGNPARTNELVTALEDHLRASK